MNTNTFSCDENGSNLQHLIPFGAIDTHVHVFDSKLGPYAAGRAYTPKDAPLEDLMKFNESLSEDPESNALVLVQPSPYGNDCSVLMQSLRRLKYEDKKAFAIAVVDLDNTTDAQLKEMHALGVRGVRLNFQADGKEVSLDRLVAALKQTADRIRYLPDWMIQLFVPGWSWDALYLTIVDLPVPVIADHLGGMLGSSKLPFNLRSAPTSQPGLHSLLKLAKQSCVHVKISGLYRMSNDTSSIFSDLQPIVQTFAKEIPDCVIWGSDWPHTGDGKNRSEATRDKEEAFRVIDNHAILGQLQSWMGDEVYRKMLVDNPRKLYND